MVFASYLYFSSGMRSGLRFYRFQHTRPSNNIQQKFTEYLLSAKHLIQDNGLTWLLGVEAVVWGLGN